MQLTANRKPHQQIITQFLQATCSTYGVKATKAEKQPERITEEKILAAKAAAVVRDVKNVALPAAVSVCHMRSRIDVMEDD